MFHIKLRYLFILLLAVYSYLNILFTEGDRLIETLHLDKLLLLAVITAIVLMIWEGNRYIEHRLRRRQFPFTGSQVHPLIPFFILSLIPVLIATMATIAVAMVITGGYSVSIATEAKLILSFSFRVNLFLNCVHAIVYYMNQLKKTQIEAEKLKKATTEAQFASLKNQVNPHFLFNSFNVLSSLVYKDADMAADYLRQLSRVYRYLLQHQDGQSVSLSQEMAFIKAYLYLLDIRFGDNLIVNNHIDDRTDTLYLAPVSLQMLIENAIKHNVVSRNHPLTISLYFENGGGTRYLIVENTLQKKETAPPSTNLGLSNIKQRYRFITDREVLVTDGPDTFKVLLPLIHIPI
ncbi:MAG: histidine kinase [Cyclobacteriaceae bacterium]